MQFHQGPHQQQADARAPPGADPGNALPHEGVEHERQYLRRYPDARVTDPQNDLGTRGLHRHRDPAAGLGVFCRIVEQVAHDQIQSLRVGLNPHRFGPEFEREAEPQALEVGPATIGGGAHRRREVHRPAVESERGVGSLAEVHEVSEQALHLPCRVFEPRPQPLRLRQQTLGVPSELDPGKNTAEGILQFVQDHGQELSPPVGGKQFARGVPARPRWLPPANCKTGRGRPVSGADGRSGQRLPSSFPPAVGDSLASFPVVVLSVAGAHLAVVEFGADATALQPMGCAMNQEHTTAVVQRYLDELGGDSPAEPIVRALLDRAVRRLHLLCASLLYRSYPRLTQPPLNLQADELLGAIAERLLKAMREARPRTVRHLFALANQHMRWELNDLARRLDNQPAAVELCEGLVPSPASSVSGLTPDGRRMLQAIDDLPEDEREVFDLVRIQGMTQTEVAQLLGVSAVTVKRRLNRGLRLLTEQLSDLRPGEKPADSI